MQDKYLGKLLDGRYQIIEIIGEGGMAVVYKALCNRLNRYVAVKIMRDEMASDEEFRRKFCAESQAVAMLSHPNIVAVYDVSHNDEIEYIVMELIDGITLKQYIDRKKAVYWKETVHFSRQICKALVHAHERGIIHRDIKPQNIMLLKDGTIKVADFGIAALENEALENREQTYGSIHYIAPEQVRGEYPDSRSDIYSLGIVMYEMLTGTLPYTGDTIGEIAVKHIDGKPAPITDYAKDVPEELCRIVLKAMSSGIEDRYSSAAELLSDLENFSHDFSENNARKDSEKSNVVPVRSVTEMPKTNFTRRRRRSQKVSFLGGAFGAIIVFMALFVFLWKFWLSDIFSPAQRISLPDFSGMKYENVVNSGNNSSVYNFTVVYVTDTNYGSGTIISQSPEPGRSVMLTNSGIDVTVTVSSGAYLVPVPDLVNLEYNEAVSLLSDLGFEFEIENVVSDYYRNGAVISTSPSSGNMLESGSTVYLTVSSGNYQNYVQMPNLIGITEELAVTKIENASLCYGGCERISSDFEAGTVIGQSVDAFTDIEEHSKIYLQVSTGKKG